MKIFKKFLMVFCAIAVLASVIGVMTTAETYTGTVNGANALINEYGSKTTPEAKDAAILDLRAYVKARKLGGSGADDLMDRIATLETRYITEVLMPRVQTYDPSASDSQKEAAIQTVHAAMSAASVLADNYDALRAAAQAADINYIETVLYPATIADYSNSAHPVIDANRASRILLSYLRLNPVDTTHPSYTAELANKLAGVRPAYEARLNAAKAALYDLASLSEYLNYPTPQYLVDFEGCVEGDKFPAAMSQYMNTKNMPNVIANNPHRYEVQMADGNKYYAINYNYFGTGGTHNYLEWKWNTSTSVVIEWDFSTDNSMVPTLTLQSAMDSSGGRIFPTWFKIGKGNFETPSGNIKISNLIHAGEWTHFTCTVNQNTGEMTVYIDYEYVGTWDRDNAGNPYLGPDYLLYDLRMGHGNGSSNWEGYSFAIDNMTVYNGLTPRDCTYFASIDGHSDLLVKFYAGVLSHHELLFSDRYLAYTKGMELVEEFYDIEHGTFREGVTDEELKAAVLEIIGTDTDEILVSVRAANLVSLKDQVAGLASMSNQQNRTLSNIRVRENTHSAIRQFINENSGLFDVTNPEYGEQTQLLNTYALYITQDKAATDFITAMKNFNYHFSQSAMERHYATAEEAYHEIDKNYIYSNATDAENFQMAISSYAGAYTILQEAIRRGNAEKIIACVRRFHHYTTEQEWEEHYDDILPYVNAARSLIRAGNYDTTVAGLAAALAIYEPVNDYFYGLLQQEHIREMGARVETFRNSTEYIQRLGAFTFITKYYEKHQENIDLGNEEIKAIMVAYGIMQEELEIQELE